MTGSEITAQLTKIQVSYCPARMRHAALIVHSSKFGLVYETTSVNFLTEVTVKIEQEKTARRNLLEGAARRLDLGQNCPNQRKGVPI
jgi:hypothetical protein